MTIATLFVLLAVAVSLYLVWLYSRYRNPVDLKGQVVMITGASSGVGRAAAHYFAAQGAQVVLIARRANLLQDLETELAQYQVPILSIPTDVTQDVDLEAAVHAIVERFGRIDILVNNAGFAVGGHFTDIAAKDVKNTLEVNTYGVIRLTQLVIPVMKRQAYGQIIIVSSIAGLIAVPGQIVYAASKFALMGFSEGLRREFASDNISVSLINPGWIETPMIANIDRELLKSTPVSQIFTTDEIAEVIITAARYRLPQLIKGGSVFYSSVMLQRLSRTLSDKLFTASAEGRDKIIELMSKLG